MKSILAYLYTQKHPNIPEDQIPYWYKRTIIGEIWHLLRKKICVVWAPNCTITILRIALYRLCGFKIGKGTFIGMQCYLDDVCVDKIFIGDNVTISYGVYFACHGIHQTHNTITIKDNAYIGMRASIIAPKEIEIGEGAIIGAQTLVNRSIPAYKIAVGVPCKIIEKK